MIKKRFDYLVPQSDDEATSLLASGNGGTEIIGGGTWVVVEMTQGMRTPSRVIDLKDAKLDYVREDDGAVVVGATATYTDVLRSSAAEKMPVLKTMATGVTGGAQVRNRGTLGGSACYATPSSDVPGFLVGLGAKLRLASKGGAREVDAAKFFLGAFRADVREGELLSEMAIPAPPPGARIGYYKFKLCESSWPIVTATAVVGADGRARIALGGASPRPVVFEADASRPDEIVRLGEQAIVEPYGDVLAGADYRRQIAGVIAKRAVLAAA